MGSVSWRRRRARESCRGLPIHLPRRSAGRETAPCLREYGRRSEKGRHRRWRLSRPQGELPYRPQTLHLHSQRHRGVLLLFVGSTASTRWSTSSAAGAHKGSPVSPFRMATCSLRTASGPTERVWHHRSAARVARIRGDASSRRPAESSAGSTALRSPKRCRLAASWLYPRSSKSRRWWYRRPWPPACRSRKERRWNRSARRGRRHPDD